MNKMRIGSIDGVALKPNRSTTAPATMHGQHFYFNTLDDSCRIIILNWNEPAETLSCVQSLQNAGARADLFIVVDNGSTDHSVALLSEKLPAGARLLRSERNLGFAGGVNLGIQEALQDRSVKWILLQNNDTRVADDFFVQLGKAVDGNDAPAYHILAPVVYYAERPDIVWSAGERRLMGTLLTSGSWRNRPILEQSDWATVLPADFVNACSMLVHREVFEAVGLFNSNFFMYGEDNEFCWRAAQAGFRIGWVPRARVWHRVGWSSRHRSAATLYWKMEGQIRFYRIASSGWQLPLLFGFTTFRALRHMLVYGYSGRWDLAWASWRGWYKGWFADAKPVSE